MKSIMKKIALMTALAAMCSAALCAAEKPNVILLFIDDLGYGDIGVFGAEDIPTPNIDRLAQEGVVLTQAYVTNPPCCPSRSSLIMGMYGQHFGKYGMSRGMPIPDDKPTFAEIFRDHGYTTGQIGKWDIGTKFQGPTARGFMEVANIPPRTDDTKNNFLCVAEDGSEVWVTEIDGDNLVEFVDRNRKANKPFMMYWSPLAVHSPHKTIPEKYPARTTASKDRRKLAGGIVCMDDQVGKLLDYLDQHKLREETLIIFSSDNGGNVSEGASSAPYRGGKGKGTQQVGWTLAPTIVSWPGVVPQGKAFDGLACTLDFYPTMLAAAGLPIPEHIDGYDLMPYLTGKQKGDVHEYIYWLNSDPNDAKHRQLVAVRRKDWRLYRQKETDAWQLFDLAKDPREETDVAKQFPEVVMQLAQKHANWKETLIPRWEKDPNAPEYQQPPKPVVGYGWEITGGNVVHEKIVKHARKK